MNEYRVLIAMPLVGDHIETYQERFEELGVEYDVPDTENPITESKLREIIGGYDGIITGFVGLDAETLEAATQLQVVSQWGIGLDDIDLDAAERNGVSVYNTPGAFSDEIADVVIGYLIMLARRLHELDREVRNGGWPSTRGKSLRGRTLGIVGVGHIGEAVARRAHAHGMNILGTDVQPIASALKRDVGIERVPHDDLFARADAVSLNCPLTTETRHLVGRPELDLLGSDGYLINTARGEVVQQPELVDALRDGDIAGAALDVFETEPLSEDHPLTEMDNVLLGSHNAGNTAAAVERTTERAVENLIRGLTDDTDS
jgi:D-3-phosphoglycerate dehydrogenase